MPSGQCRFHFVPKYLMPAHQPRSHPAPQLGGGWRMAGGGTHHLPPATRHHKGRCSATTAIAEIVVRREIHALGEAQLAIASLSAEAIQESGPATAKAHASPG